MTRDNKSDIELIHDNKSGRPLSFTVEQLWQVENLAMLGATNVQLSLFFRVSESTINYWIRNSEDFTEARQRGGLAADMEVVKALYKRAIGFVFQEEKIFRVGRRLKTKKVNTYIIPDVKAASLWLAARQREQWTLTQKVNHTGTITHKHTKVEDLPIHELKPETQEFLFEITQAQLTETDGSRDN